MDNGQEIKKRTRDIVQKQAEAEQLEINHFYVISVMIKGRFGI